MIRTKRWSAFDGNCLTQATFDRFCMRAAIAEAKESRRLGDYAIGSVIAHRGRVIVRAGNRIRTEVDSTSHTEIVAIRMASRDLGSRYLRGCTLYSTHAPCPMCLGACVWAKVSRVVYGASQADISEYGSLYGNPRFKWRAVDIEPGGLYKFMKRAHQGMRIEQLMAAECRRLFHHTR